MQCYQVVGPDCLWPTAYIVHHRVGAPSRSYGNQHQQGKQPQQHFKCLGEQSSVLVTYDFITAFFP